VLLLLTPLAASIPLAAPAAILFGVAWNMSDIERFKSVMRTAPAADRWILLITFLLTVFAAASDPTCDRSLGDTLVRATLVNVT